ncbi:hypothetical protein COCNU_14G012030 [Cocos nucifera]|uniref:Uncharacterized protein n=1 Tax=Cocos nucifera TaxID=13894 RepID=A0A8K0IWC9_COCNU|nr:hypothetical protein COCNU_14G012030 [Cocos nucifera]
MSGGEVRKVSRQDIQLVQNLIERCLQLYMNQKEVVETLSLQAKIEPSFTELVWQKLEEENREFFKAYHVRLMLKNQIMVFNNLLEKQVELMHKVCSSGVAPIPLSNGSNSSALHQTPSCYLSEHASTSSRPDGMLCNGGAAGAILHGRPAVTGIQLGNDASVLTGSMDTSTSLLSTQNSAMGRLQGINGTAIKSEPSYSGNSEFSFCADSSFLEAQPPIADPPAGSFSSSELTGQPLNDPLPDEPFGFLSQIPRNFSFSDLADHFTQSTDILENYGRSPFLPAEANNFSSSPGECKEGENRRLDSISEGVSYEDFENS